ncbi:MAG TPA: hypothetical protein VHW46_05935 [Terracidiphilus sp.]|jgi:hypothetical protein|nr:hypothetical protein [Terracidiphilus sp.]
MPSNNVLRFLTNAPVLALGAVLVVAAFSTPTKAAKNGAWIDNGATACEKYVTPDVVTAILRIPGGRPMRLAADSCHVGPIYVTLKVADINIFRQEISRILGAHTIGGFGDGAYWNEAGAFSAVKGHDRGCDISVIDPGAQKIHNAELGRKLGEICNRLFAIQ